MNMPDLFDAQPLTADVTPEEPKPAEPEKSSEIPDALPPLPIYKNADEALAAIIAAFDRKPNYFKGFAVLSSELSDAILAAKMMTRT